MGDYQTIGLRFLALIIDSMVMLVLFIIYLLLNRSGNIADYFGNILIAVIPIAYTVFMHARYGQTLGKMAAKVKVFDVSETPINSGQSVIRSLPQIIPLIFVIGFNNPQVASEADKAFMPYIFSITTGLIWIWNIADIIVALSNSKHRALHDYIAGTVVVKL